MTQPRCKRHSYASGKLRVDDARFLQTFNEGKALFAIAKSEARTRYPESADQTRDATREIANVYATCRAYAQAIHERIGAIGAASKKPATHDTDEAIDVRSLRKPLPKPTAQNDETDFALDGFTLEDDGEYDLPLPDDSDDQPTP